MTRLEILGSWRMYLRWLGLILASFVVDLFGVFVVPFAIAMSDGRKLPGWAALWDNDREPLGDADRKPAIDAATGFWRGFLRWRWLCVRNPGNNFGYLCGALPIGQWISVGDPLTSDQGHPGRLFVRCDNAWCIYLVKRYSDTRCVRIALGWKVWDRAQTLAQIVCVINPFMTFEARG